MSSQLLISIAKIHDDHAEPRVVATSYDRNADYFPCEVEAESNCSYSFFNRQPRLRSRRNVWCIVRFNVEGENMGRIVASVKIDNVLDATKSLRCDALVDTGASHMVLPTAWKDRLGQLESTRTIQMETATQELLTGEVCGPVRIQIEGFPTVYSEVAFVEMKPAN